MRKFMEIEFKYLADELPLATFDKFCRDRKPEKILITSGWDKFYDNPQDPGAFARHRTEVGKFNQLSFKRKTADKNNFIRVEHNIDLSVVTSDEQVAALMAEFKFTFNRAIFKNCFIYVFQDYVLCYYTVFDENMREMDRFVEIEVSEEYPWPSEQAAWDRLTQLEAEVALPGIAARNRTKLSLFERYRKS